MKPRPTPSGAIRAAAAGTSLVGLLVIGIVLPAVALADDSGGEPTGSGAGAAMLRIGLVTLLLLIVIGTLAALPRMLKRPRYRPGKPWPYDPLWFAGPENPEAALAGTRPLRGTGGASGDW